VRCWWVCCLLCMVASRSSQSGCWLGLVDSYGASAVTQREM
jgi:hypothetical protein